MAIRVWAVEVGMKAKPLLAALLGIAAAAGALADDPRAVEIVQGKCFICHGTDGESSSPVFPRLAGQHARYIERQLADYKHGRRKSSAASPPAPAVTARPAPAPSCCRAWPGSMRNTPRPS